MVSGTTLEDGTDRLSRNVDNELLFYAALLTEKPQRCTLTTTIWTITLITLKLYNISYTHTQSTVQRTYISVTRFWNEQDYQHYQSYMSIRLESLRKDKLLYNKFRFTSLCSAATSLRVGSISCTVILQWVAWNPCNKESLISWYTNR